MTYDFYPFTSENVIWTEGNKVLLNEDDSYTGFVCLEKNMVHEVLRSEMEAQKMVIEGHLCKIEFIIPKLSDKELLPILKDSKIKRLNNTMELSCGDPGKYNLNRKVIEEKYLKDLDDAGCSHLTYGFAYPGYPEKAVIIKAIKQLEKQILEF